MSTEEDSAGEIKPTWLTRDCPAWCVAVHVESDMFDDRKHYSASDTRFLLTQEPHKVGIPTPHEYEPLTFMVELWQHYREIEPRVWLADSSDRWLDCFTLEEAEWLAAALNSMIRAARDVEEIAA